MSERLKGQFMGCPYHDDDYEACIQYSGQAPCDPPDGWHRAIDEALVTHHLGVADSSDSYEDAKRKLGELIDWHVAVATDERANGGYRLVPVDPTSSTTKTP